MAYEEPSWFERLGNWRSWAHMLAAAAVGAAFGWLFPGLTLYAAFGGIPWIAVAGAVMIALLATVLGGISIAFHGGRTGLWASFTAIPIVICMLAGMFVLATRTFDPTFPDFATRSVLAGAVTLGGFALLSWTGPQQVIAIAGLGAAVLFLPQWPYAPPPAPITAEPPYPGGETEPPFPTFPVYHPVVDGYASFDLPGVIYPDGAQWSFTRDGGSEVALTMLSFGGPGVLCDASQIYVDPYLGVFDDPASCVAAPVDGMSGVFERKAILGYELCTVIAGHLVRVAAPYTTPHEDVEAALRTAVPMSNDEYAEWREERVDPYY